MMERQEDWKPIYRHNANLDGNDSQKKHETHYPTTKDDEHATHRPNLIGNDTGYNLNMFQFI